MPTPCLPIALCFLGVLPISAAAQERHLDDDALAPIAADLAAYFEARRSARGLDEARSALAARIGDSSDLLRHPADLARVTWLSRGYAGRKVRAGKVDTERFAEGRFAASGLEYAYRLPKEYDPAATAYPLILAIPDEGERPADHLRTSWTLREIQDGAILVSPEMPMEQQDWVRLTVDGRPGGLSHVLTALRIATERFAVDPDRVYVAGRGKGVPAAIAAGNYSPQRFAGIIGRAGDAGELGPDNFDNLPSYFAGAGGEATAFHAEVQEFGFDNCTLDPGGGEKDVWHWIQGNPRDAHPARVTLWVGNPFPTRAHWLRVAPTAQEAHAFASIDEESNTIRIDGEGFSHAVLYLDDALVDLSRPVRVVCNGEERTISPERRLSTALDLLHDGTSDAGCAYVAEAVIDVSGAAPAVGRDAAEDPEYSEFLAAAAGDVDALWELWRWCEANGRSSRREAVLLRLLRLDADHGAARTALGHHGSPGRWFTTRAAYERFVRGQDDDAAREKGHVKLKSVWVHPDERKLAKGRTKDHDTGLWLTGAEQKKLAAGWVRQDHAWIPPEEADRVADGLWRVEGEWLDLASANRRHSRIDSMWHIPTATVSLHSTADRATSLTAAEHMARAIDDVRRVFGAEPMLPLDVVVLRDEAQYERFAIGDPGGTRGAAHGDRLYVIHSAVLAESWFPRVDGELEFRGAGACYWDVLMPHGDLYGVHSARLAAALSYVDALDPSPKAVRRALKEGVDGEFYPAYLEEKKLPAWLRYGGAVYAERFFRDTTVAEDGDPWWARKWSLENLEQREGLRPLADVLAFRLDPDDIGDSQKLLIEAGLVVAFVVDGGSGPVVEAHTKLKQALVLGRLHANHIEALEEAITAHEADLRAFAELEPR